MSLPPVSSASIPAMALPIVPPITTTTAGQNPTPAQVGNVPEHHRPHEDKTHSPVKLEVSAAAAAAQGEPKG